MILMKLFILSVGVTKVKIKTGTLPHASSDATPDLQICDGLGTCCKTLGLDNSGNDRPSGQIDVYKGLEILADCTKVESIMISVDYDVI